MRDDRASRREILAGTGAKKFEVATQGRAVYATGWDGSIVVTLFSDGTPPKVTVRRDASPSPGPGTESQEGN